MNYYSLVNDPAGPYIHARYVPPWKTTVLGIDIAEGDRRRMRKVRWTWRAVTLPVGGDECANGKTDSAAVVYVTWKRGLRYHAIKYVWSAVGQRGRTCDRKRSPFVAQDTVILESGGPLEPVAHRGDRSRVRVPPSLREQRPEGRAARLRRHRADDRRRPDEERERRRLRDVHPRAVSGPISASLRGGTPG